MGEGYFKRLLARGAIPRTPAKGHYPVDLSGGAKKKGKKKK